MSGAGVAPAADPAEPRDGPAGAGEEDFPVQFYGGQAVIEGVMMRGAATWAVAARRPTGEIYVETHPVSDFPQRHPLFTKPMFRGMFALVDALAIGSRGLRISANQAYADEEEEQPVGGGTFGVSLAFALVLFIGVFIVLPNFGVSLFRGVLGTGVVYHLVEGVVRIAIFLAYLSLISLIGDIRRVFMYHGAEHKTIAAWEHDEPLVPDRVDRYSTLHVRCGTNFLLLVMILATVVYSVAGIIVPAPAGGLLVQIAYQVALRVVLLPVVAGFAYEGIRLGARRSNSAIVRALMTPGLWLQKITTRPPTPDQIEVAIRAFEAVVPPERLDGRVGDLPSPLVRAEPAVEQA